MHRNGKTEQTTRIDRAWLNQASDAVVWVDLAAPSIPETLILSDTFGFHPLAVEDARSPVQYPKAEAYDGYLYVILHGIDFDTTRRDDHGGLSSLPPFPLDQLQFGKAQQVTGSAEQHFELPSFTTSHQGRS